MRRLASLRSLVTVALVAGGVLVGGPTPAPASAGEVGGCELFPADTFWHAEVERLSPHPQSAQWTSRWLDRGLKMDFGSGVWPPGTDGEIGIPFTTVPASQPDVPVTFAWYPDESDPGPYPIPPDAPVEGPTGGDGDRHVLVVQEEACTLYELYAAVRNGGGTSWTAGSGAVWDLGSHQYRGQPGWTSADAAGLPILPALVRHDEALAGTIDHPLRITVPCTAPSYVWPARHHAGSDPSCPPMGAWLRLKPTVDLSGFSPTVRHVLEALQTYGAIVADNGSAWYVSGVPDPAWSNDDLNDTRSITGRDLEFVDVSTLRVDGGANSTMRVQDTGQRFTDVPPPHPFFTEIGWLDDEGVTTGYPDLTFRPALPVSRQATVAFLHRLSGAPAGPFPDPGFADVDDDHPFATEIAWAAAEGVVGGYADGTFGPARPVSRQAMAAFLHGWLDGGPGPFPDPGVADVAPGRPFYLEISWLVEAGIATGYGDGTFRPASAVSRQAMAAFLHRAAG